MAYSWTQFSASVGSKITAGSLATALSQANAMVNNFMAGGFSSHNNGHNSGYNGSTDSDFCNAFGCYTHFSGNGSKCGAYPVSFTEYMKMIGVK